MKRVWCLAALVACIAIDAGTADACATAPPDGAKVDIATEEALIVWNPATKTETFVRRSEFLSTAKAFGFLVPTPSVPTIAEAPSAVFDALASLTAPEVRYDTETELEPSGLACLTMGSEKSAPATAQRSAVRELQSVHVAGYEAITVEADDPAALGGWLAKHSFAVTPQLTAWLGWYVDHKWKLTAFVFRATDETPDVTTKSIALTFQTERPFYPYREPTPTSTDNVVDRIRMLRLYVLSSERMAATFADHPWKATLVAATTLPATLSPELAALAGSARRLTKFHDEGRRDGSDEVYFAPSADQAEVKPPVEVIERTNTIPIPIDLILLVAIAIALVIRHRRRRRRRPEPNLA